jgi:hypothetical protein
MENIIQKRAHEVTIYGRFYRVGVEDLVQPDEWAGATRLHPSVWEKSEFYLPSFRYTDVVLAVNVKVTGRTFQRRPFSDRLWVRVQITFVHDGEPDEVCSGWWNPESAW